MRKRAKNSASLSALASLPKRHDKFIKEGYNTGQNKSKEKKGYPMQQIQITNKTDKTDRTDQLIRELFHIWEKSVKATHLFLSEKEIKEIAKFVPTALTNVPHLIIANNEHNAPIAFMGIDHNKLEMLFIAPEERGKGIGKQLLEFGIKNYHVNELCVNEQNPQAKGFYEHMGFQVYQRTDTDEQGNPYPILYMSLKK